MADLDNISEEEKELYAEVYEEEESAQPPDDNWWPLARKALIVCAIIGGLVWWFGTDTMEAREAKQTWLMDCRASSPRDLCEDVADEFHDVCYHDHAKGQTWLHRVDKLHAVVTGNAIKKNIYRMLPEYIEFLYVECLDERLQEAKKKAQ